MIKVGFNDIKYTLQFGRYRNGDISISLQDNYRSISATMDFANLRKNEVLIHNISEKQGIEDVLIYAGVIKSRPNRKVSIGFNQCNVYELTGLALQELKFQENISRNAQGSNQVAYA